MIITGNTNASLLGAVSIFDIFGNYLRRSYSPNPIILLSDEEAMYKDWELVGDDFRDAYLQLVSDIQTERQYESTETN